MSVAALMAVNADGRDMEREVFLDNLVADIAGSLVMLREPCYGGHVALTPDQVWERSRAIATRIVLGYDIKPIGGGR